MRTTSIVSAFAIGIFLAAGAVTQSNAAAGFDGDWSVAIQTTQGKCGSYRAGLQVAGGRVLSSPGDYAVSGTVSASGATVVTVINEEGSATGTGRLQGSSGSGRWRSSTGECSGTWNAMRRP